MKTETTGRQRGGQATRLDPYDLVTHMILEHLEKGTVPWRCPWNRKVGRPRNFHSGNPYQGINPILLGCRCFASPHWLTIRQANMLGGRVRKGEHGTLVVKYGQYEKKSDEGATEDTQKCFYLKTYVVFNAFQIDGIQFPPPEGAPPLSSPERISAAENIVASMPRKPKFTEGNTVQAGYRPKLDTVEMPSLDRFESGESYYLTLFHELVHSTGHESRLNRKSLVENDGFHGKEYSKEELVAEMGAAFLAMEADITSDGHEQSASYLQGWLHVLREPDHRRWIVEAASQATKAAQYILGTYVSSESACIVV